jgi:hypothetical protein
MNKPQDASHLSELILRKLDGSITRQQQLELFNLLESEPGAVDRYVELMLLYSCLCEPGSRPAVNMEPLVISGEAYSLSLKALGEYENRAMPKQSDREESDSHAEAIVLLDKSAYASHRRINKASLVTVAASLAALFLMIAYVHFFPAPAREAVATITDSIDAKWADTDLPAGIDSALSNADGIRNLLRGCVKIQFFSGAEVVIEAPAEFEMTGIEQMKLNSGRLFAAVPQRAGGFTVDTPSSRIVDIGTQFGIKVDFDGTSDLHMFKGHAFIAARADSENALSRQASQGQAFRVNPSRETIESIPVKEQMFVRSISSGTRFVWRGEPLDLANLASGGDGISKWGVAAAIDPRTGARTHSVHVDRDAPNGYVAVSWNPYVDGVFVPNGRQPQTVTSQHHVFNECPPTNGLFCDDIIVNQASDPMTEMVLRGVTYGVPEHPAIFLHANLGMTFDLEAIRACVPQASDFVFRSEIGVSEVGSSRPCNADFWVVVDGQVRYQKRNVTEKGPCDQIELRLGKNDRFLTLITTDGQSPTDTPDLRQTDSDWCLFAEPRLESE